MKIREAQGGERGGERMDFKKGVKRKKHNVG